MPNHQSIINHPAPRSGEVCLSELPQAAESETKVAAGAETVFLFMWCHLYFYLWWDVKMEYADKLLLTRFLHRSASEAAAC